MTDQAQEGDVLPGDELARIRNKGETEALAAHIEGHTGCRFDAGHQVDPAATGGARCNRRAIGVDRGQHGDCGD